MLGGRSKRARAAVAALALPLIAAGCFSSSDNLNTAKIEKRLGRAVEGEARARTGIKVKYKVRCPDRVTAESGTRFSCMIENPAGAVVPATVELKDKRGKVFTYRLQTGRGTFKGRVKAG